MSPGDDNTGIPTVTDVVLRYESLCDRGEEVTAEALCARMGCPQLLDEVRQQIRDLESIRQFLKSTTIDFTPGGPGQDAEPGRQPPPKIDIYEVRERVGTGGFGVVWRGHDPELDRPVAIKVPRPDRRFPEEEISQFLREARKAAALDHPNIVKVYHAKRRGTTFFIATEFIAGDNLRARAARGGFTPAEAARLVAQVAEALHHAHLRGFVHRDVKPGNILVNRDQKPYLTDFGLAVTEEEQLDEGPGVAGTVAYMSPEQAQGGSHRADARSDIYSLGVVFYEMLTGRLPFVAKTTKEYLDQIIHRDPRPPRTIKDSIPPEMERICLKCLAKRVADRYTTAADLAADLRQWLEHNTPAEPSAVTPLMARVPAPLPRWRWLVPAAIVGLVALGLAIPVVQRHLNPGTGPEPKPSATGTGGEPGPAPVVIVKPKPGEWQNLLDISPVALKEPKGPFKWGYDPNQKELWWDTQGDCLFRLGSADVPDYEIEVTFEQTHLAAHRGLFLGYRTDPTGKHDLPPCQLLLIVPDALKKSQFFIFRGELALGGPGQQPQFKELGAHVPLPPAVSDKKFTLAVRVQGGKLTAVRIDKTLVEGLGLGGVDQPAPLAGDFGVFADLDSARVTRARWKISAKEN